jgi:type IV fimbrial biogenesis protein FimT
MSNWALKPGAAATTRLRIWTVGQTMHPGCRNEGSILPMELPAENSRTQRGRRASEAGFTLVELLVTISLASLLMAIGIPMFRETIASNRLTGEANDLVAAITMARSQAITANQRVVFCRADSDAAVTCSGTAGNWEFWLITNAAGTVIRRGDVPGHGGAIEVSSTLINDQVTFASDGLARTNNVLVAGEQIVVCSNHSAINNQRQITLGAGSRVSTARVSGGC